VQALREMKFEVDPSVSAKYAQANRQVSEGFNNPAGAYTTPAVREAVQRSAKMRLAQGEAQELREGGHQNQSLDYARKAAVAEMTAPRLTQSGQSGYGTQVVQPGPSTAGQIAQGAAGVASAALM
jgi:hypothetical protein